MRGSHAVIEGRAGFITRAGLAVGDRVALREAQAPRPARDVAPWRSALDEDGESPRAADRCASGHRPEVDPWDVGSLEAPSASPVPPSQVRSEKSGARGGSAARTQSTQAPGAFPRRSARATARPPDADRVVRSRRDHGRESARRCCRTRRQREGEFPRPTRSRSLPRGKSNCSPKGRGMRRRRDSPGLLHALSEGAQGLPVQLRLLVLQELSPSPACATTLEFSTKLALYERPGRANLIRGVYERFQRLPPRDAESTPASQPAHAPAPQPEAWWRRRVVRGPPPRRWPSCWSSSRRPGCGTRRLHRRRGPSTVAGPWRARSPRRVRR